MFWPKYTVFIGNIKNSDFNRVCILSFCKNRTDVAFEARPGYALYISVASCWMLQSWTENELSLSKGETSDEVYTIIVNHS